MRPKDKAQRAVEPVILGRPDHESSRRFMRHYTLTREYDRQHADWENHVTDRLEWSPMPDLDEAIRHDRQMFRTRYMDRDWRAHGPLYRRLDAAYSTPLQPLIEDIWQEERP